MTTAELSLMLDRAEEWAFTTFKSTKNRSPYYQLSTRIINQTITVTQFEDIITKIHNLYE